MAVTRPKEKKQKTNIGNSNSKPKAPAKKREIKTSNQPSNDSDLKSDKAPRNVLLKQPERQKMMTIGSRIKKIINHRLGPITADEVIEVLNKDGFRQVNPETVRPFVETQLRRARG